MLVAVNYLIMKYLVYFLVCFGMFISAQIVKNQEYSIYAILIAYASGFGCGWFIMQKRKSSNCN